MAPNDASRLRLRNHPQLLPQSEHVQLHPVLAQFAILHNPAIRESDVNRLAGRGDANEHARVCSGKAASREDLIALANHALVSDFEAAEGVGVYLGCHRKAGWPGLWHRKGGIDEIRLEIRRLRPLG